MNSLQDLLQHPLFALSLTLAAFELGLLAYRRTGQFAILHPTVSGALLVALLLPWIKLDYATYFDGTEWLRWLLGPATVALAVPMYRQWHLIRAQWRALSVTLLIGASWACASALMVAHWLGANALTLRSLAPKSVTTPIAMGLSEMIGGSVILTTGAVVFTGAIGIILAPFIFRLTGVNDPRVEGFTLGLAAHGVGTARAFEQNATAGAFASLGLCLTGTLTASALPWIAPWLP